MAAEVAQTAAQIDALGGFAVNGTTVIDSSGVVLATLDVTAAGVTTGIALGLDDNTGLTTGQIIKAASSATAITTTGRLFLSSHSGTTGTSATLNEFISAATDETVVLQAKASAALAAGKVVNISGAAVTTGVLLDISDNTAHTTGTAVNIVTNSADTGTRTLLNVKQDHASATGATAVTITQDSTAAALALVTTPTGAGQTVTIVTAATTVTSGVVSITGAGVTTGCGIKITLAALTSGAAIDTTGLAANTQVLNVNSSTGSTAAPQTNAPTGFFKIGVAGADRWVPFYSST